MFGTGPAFSWVLLERAMHARNHIINGLTSANRHIIVMIKEKEPVYKVMLDGQQLAARLTKTMREMTFNQSITVTLNMEKINEHYR